MLSLQVERQLNEGYAMRLSPSIPSMWSQRSKHHLLAIGGVALLSACSSAPQPVAPIPLSVTVQTTTKINPDSFGRPSPTKVVFYELKSSATFETADFFSLSQKDQATLGADLLGKEEFFLRPGESKTLTRKGFLETAALGIYVEFRDIDKSIWRATATVPTAEASGGSPSFSGTNPKKYQVLIDQHSVKFVAVTETNGNLPTPAPAAAKPATANPAAPN